MVEEKLLTVREVSFVLDISEKEVIELVDSGALPAYKVGGVYLRFKRQQIEDFKKSFKHPAHKNKPVKKHSFKDKVSDFFYFNDFYILSALIIIVLLVFIFKEY